MPHARSFPVQLLKEWDFPWGMNTLHEEHVGKDRWCEHVEIVFEAPDDGRTYAITIQRGLTEYQDGHDMFGGDDEVEGVLVEKREVTVTRWLPVQ
jgi:hypothetical protein